MGGDFLSYEFFNSTVLAIGEKDPKVCTWFISTSLAIKLI